MLRMGPPRSGDQTPNPKPNTLNARLETLRCKTDDVMYLQHELLIVHFLKVSVANRYPGLYSAVEYSVSNVYA